MMTKQSFRLPGPGARSSLACCCGSRTCVCWTDEHAGPAAMARAAQTRQGPLPSSLVLARHRAGERSPGRGVAVMQVGECLRVVAGDKRLNSEYMCGPAPHSKYTELSSFWEERSPFVSSGPSWNLSQPPFSSPTTPALFPDILLSILLKCYFHQETFPKPPRPQSGHLSLRGASKGSHCVTVH